MWATIIGIAGIIGTFGGVWWGAKIAKQAAIELENNRQKGEIKRNFVEIIMQIRDKWNNFNNDHGKGPFDYKRLDMSFYTRMDQYINIDSDRASMLKDEKNKWVKLQAEVGEKVDRVSWGNREDYKEKEHIEILEKISNILTQ